MHYTKWKAISYGMILSASILLLCLCFCQGLFAVAEHNWSAGIIIAAYIIGFVIRYIFVDPHEPYLTIENLYGYGHDARD